MLKKNLLLLLLFSLFLPLFSIENVDSSRTGKCDHRIGILTDYFLLFHNRNIAANAFLGKSDIASSFGNDFLLKETATYAIGARISYHANVFSITVSQSGYSKFGELQAGCGYAKCFAGRFAAGVRFWYWLNYAMNYEKVHSVTFDIAIFTKINEKAGFGLNICNPARLKYGINRKNRYSLPTLFQLDMYYSLNSKIVLSSVIEKELSSYFKLKAGLLYRLTPALCTEISVDLPEPSLAVGVKISWRSFYIDFHSAYHLKLGFSPCLTVFYFLR